MKVFLKRLAMVVVPVALLATAYLVYQAHAVGLLRSPSYDTVAPAIPELERPAILVLNKTNGFIHKEGLPAAGRMLSELAAASGWHLYTTENAASHNVADLARFDVVIWNNTSGDILTPEQRAAFRTWLEAGGGWLGIHAAGGDHTYDWAWYRDTLLGAQFIGHTMSPQFQDADVMIADSSPLTAHLPNPWRVNAEEWYAFDRNPRATGAQILLVMDEESYDTDEAIFPDASMHGEHPIAWTKSIGKGQMIYSAIGHTSATYELPAYREFVRKAIAQLLVEE